MKSKPASGSGLPPRGKADVGDDREDVGLVALEEGEGLLVARGEEYLGPRAGAQELVRLDALLRLDEGLGLALHDLEEQGQVARVVAHRVLDEEDDAHEAGARVGVDVAEVLDQLEHPDEELRVAVPHEDPVDRLQAPRRTELARELAGAFKNSQARVVRHHEENGHARPFVLHRARQGRGAARSRGRR